MNRKSTLQRRSTAALAALMILLGGCSSGGAVPPDDALAGRVDGGVIQPVTIRNVRIGTGGRQTDGCASQASVVAAGARVQFAPVAGDPPRRTLDGGASVYVCESDGEWRGIIYPAAGQSRGDCVATRRFRTPREYMGPCGWGWVRAADLAS